MISHYVDFWKYLLPSSYGKAKTKSCKFKKRKKTLSNTCMMRDVLLWLMTHVAVTVFHRCLLCHDTFRRMIESQEQDVRSLSYSFQFVCVMCSDRSEYCTKAMRSFRHWDIADYKKADLTREVFLLITMARSIVFLKVSNVINVWYLYLLVLKMFL